ncbi:MAG: hypothetical protein ACI9YB_001615, partial [Halioglobus sp.]
MSTRGAAQGTRLLRRECHNIQSSFCDFCGGGTAAKLGMDFPINLSIDTTYR